MDIIYSWRSFRPIFPWFPILAKGQYHFELKMDGSLFRKLVLSLNVCTSWYSKAPPGRISNSSVLGVCKEDQNKIYIPFPFPMQQWLQLSSKLLFLRNSSIFPYSCPYPLPFYNTRYIPDSNLIWPPVRKIHGAITPQTPSVQGGRPLIKILSLVPFISGSIRCHWNKITWFQNSSRHTKEPFFL